jgi:hypothetical protein
MTSRHVDTAYQWQEHGEPMMKGHVSRIVPRGETDVHCTEE